MNTKIILSGIMAATALVGIAVAQTPTAPSGGPGGGPREREGRGPRMEMSSRDDIQAMVDARLAGAKAALKLTPEQERLWGPVDQAARAMAAERMTRYEQRRTMREQRRQSNERPDFMMQLEQMTERTGKSAENLKTVSAAMKPLWASLDERQKRLLPRLIRPSMMEARGGMMEGRGMRGYHGMRGHHGQQSGSTEQPDQQPPAPR